MSWKDQLSKAVGSIKDAAESETAQRFAAKAKQTATTLVVERGRTKLTY